MLSEYNGSPDPAEMIGVNQGDVDLAALKCKAGSLAGIAGFELSGTWFGEHNDLTYQFGDKAPESLTTAILNRGRGAGTLADDPVIRAVLEPDPQAAVIGMGTIFAGLGSIWLKAAGTPFAKATTTVSGSAVVTRLTDVKVTDFNMKSVRFSEYPGFNSTRR